MNQVILCEDVLDPDSWEHHQVEDIRDFLLERFAQWPSTGRIYHEQVAQDHDVTPSDETGIERLGELSGTFYVVVYPGDPVTVIVAVVAVVAAAAVAFLLQPAVPNVALRNTQAESPNNELSDRKNKPRPNGRIPDIFGTVRSTPDLLSSYKAFRQNEEVEIAYMCIGRGEYEVPASEVRDGETQVEAISGSSVEVYSPFTSPNSGDSPQLRIGPAINTRVRRADRSNSVNGQVLRPPNDDSFTGSSDTRFVYPDIIEGKAGQDIEYDNIFIAGDIVEVSQATYTGQIPGTGYDSNASVNFRDGGFMDFSVSTPAEIQIGDVVTISGTFYTYNSGANGLSLDGTYVVNGRTSTDVQFSSPENVNPNWQLLADNFDSSGTGFKAARIQVPSGTQTLDLAGTYTILSVSSTQIVLQAPSAINADWELLDDIGGQTGYVSPIISTSGPKWIGPFILEDVDKVVANFVANNGLYKDDGKRQRRMIVAVALEITPVDNSNTPTGPAQEFHVNVVGSETSRSTRAETLEANPTIKGRVSVRARRISITDLGFEGTVMDEVKWRDLYAMVEVDQADFGNVTTVQSVTYATAGALAVKERKLNMLVTRRVPQWTSGTDFSAPVPSNNAADIIAAVALDPYIGNRQVDELDLPNIYETVEEVADYFGSRDVTHFCYTFDNDNMSFEETIASIASSVFSTAYRQGSKIRLKLEKMTEDSTLLFNHRNKVPGSETRTVRFGPQDNFDGVEYEWVDPKDDSLVTFYLPPDKSAIKPKKVESIGVRNLFQATKHAWRIWNKVRYQTTNVEFEGLQEAELLVISDRILVADNTRPDTQDGDVISQEGLLVLTSQELDFNTEGVSPYIMFLQHVDGSVESIPASPGITANSAILARAPKMPLSVGYENYARATYQLVRQNMPRTNAFLLSEREMKERLTCQIRAMNYDSAYYMTEGLVLWVPFNEDGYNDLSGFNGYLTPSGNGTGLISDLTRGSIYRGQSNSSYLTPREPVITPESYTKTIWARMNDTTVIGQLISSLSTDDEAFVLVPASGGRVLVQGWHNNGDTKIETETTSPMAWRQYVLTYDSPSQVFRLYIDGTLYVEMLSAPSRSLNPVQVGGRKNAMGFVGALDDVRVYNRALSENEVRDLFQQTRL